MNLKSHSDTEHKVTVQSTADKKIELFRSLFRGREDVYALRWESIKSNKSGYSPACANEWKQGRCHKPKVKCTECTHRVYSRLTNNDIYEHLSSQNRKIKRTGHIDIAIMQSLVGKHSVKEYVKDYGQVIVDECHHVSAFSFEKLMKEINAKFVYGLTATPTRKDGHHPIVKMQCGEILYKVNTKTMLSLNTIKYKVIPRFTDVKETGDEKTSIQEYYREIVNDEERNNMIFNDVLKEIEKGSTPLLLTERTSQLEYFQEKFKGFVKNIIIMRGGMGKKQRKTLEEQIIAIKDNDERLIIATGRYIGEGFDDNRLDCLFLAMPISWKGTLQQYVGRLHRNHANKTIVQVYDYVDVKIPMLNKMYEKRKKGYKNMGYEIEERS